MRRLDLTPRKMLELGELVTDLLGHGHPSVQAAGFVFCCGLEMGNHFFFFLYQTPGTVCLFLPVCWRVSMARPSVDRVLGNRASEGLTGAWSVAQG